MVMDPVDPNSPAAAANWTAVHAAVERTMRQAPEGGALLLELLLHPAYPFVGRLEPTAESVPSQLRAMATTYLERVCATLPEASAFGREHWVTAALPWEWLDLTWGAADLDDKPADARLSFWSELEGPDGPSDRIAVLLAGPQARNADGHQHSLGGGQALCVVAHVAAPQASGARMVRITGATFANPPTPSNAAVEALTSGATPAELLMALRDRATAMLQPDAEYAVRELSITPSGIARVSGNLTAGTRLNPRSMAWSMRTVSDEGGGNGLAYEYLVTQVMHATSAPKAMTGDPASAGSAMELVKRRPTRPDGNLEKFLHDTTRLPPVKAGLVPTYDLQEDGATPRVVVHGTHLAQNTYDAAVTPQKVPAAGLPLRSDDQAAVHAYLRGVELMDRLEQSGLAPASYFRFAKLPLILRHHAAMNHGRPDGDTINAQVQPLGSGQSYNAAFDANLRPQLEVRFGKANLNHHRLLSGATGRPRPQYMGLAADRRWAWHEFGHVLSFAATGELEFGFSHSAGDALAAILNDPDSQLARDGTEPRRNQAVGGLTFPWVPIKRRHDRDVDLGWCWCGRRNLRRLSPLQPGAGVFTGYFAEQLLSTTLFRLYRALGGDTFGNADLRHKAADYTAYLVMRATQLLGPATTVAASQATHFFEALVQADVGTSSWQLPLDGSASPAGPRIGGMAHKVVRWAFEQQGLFATEDPAAIVEGAGLPPKVDIHVFGDGSAQDGGYGPHALDWVELPTEPAPGWHAGNQGLSVQGGTLSFKVRNRGTEVAEGVEAIAWAAAAGPAPLVWQPLAPQSASPAVDIGPRGFTTFSFAVGNDLSGNYFLAASANCAGDPSNLDPASGLPCAATAASPMPPSDHRLVAELVAGDNNIGLVLLELP